MDKAIFDKAAGALPDACFRDEPALGVVLGSGWDMQPDDDEIVARVDYRDVPGLGATGVQGHAGELVVFRRYGRTVVLWRGRRHFYEGIGWEPVVMPVEILRRMGCQNLLLTNAVGGINSALQAGDFVIVRDHLNLVGQNPLIGAHNSEWGERFPDMSEVYSRRFCELLHAGVNRLGLRAMSGVYGFTSGPCYETPAEVKAYAVMGADVVGMSTVPEAIFAHACGMKVAGISFVSNLAAGIASTPLSHQEVIAASTAAKPQMVQLLGDFLERVLS